MSTFSTKSDLTAAYLHLLDRIQLEATKNPEAYPSLRKIAEDAREWTQLVGRLDNLPPVPEKPEL